ncbi:MAG: class I SAM-dependent methyltransferase, partial [Planctomycetota bacterium]
MLKWIGVTLVILIVLLVFQQTVVRLVRRFWHFSSPPFFGPFLNSRLRLKFQQPEVIIDRSGIRDGMRVLDVGCGSGAYTAAAARAVGPDGRVYALDIQEAMLRQLERKLAKRENSDIGNVEVVLGNAFDMPFEDGSFDAAFMVTA